MGVFTSYRFRFDFDQLEVIIVSIPMCLNQNNQFSIHFFAAKLRTKFSVRLGLVAEEHQTQVLSVLKLVFLSYYINIVETKKANRVLKKFSFW